MSYLHEGRFIIMSLEDLGRSKGVLFARGSQLRKWAEIYAAVSDGIIYLYKDLAQFNKSNPFETVVLSGMTVEDVDERARKHVFAIFHPGLKRRLYYFSAKDEAEKTLWAEKVGESIQLANPSIFGVPLHGKPYLCAPYK